MGRGYIFNPPKISDNKIKNNGCFENIFKEVPDLNDNKLYACGFASIDIYNNAGQFEPKNTTISFLSFYSEIYIRKGDEGWHISTTFDNHSGDARYDHQIHIYVKQRSVGWTKIKTLIADIDVTAREDPNKENEIFLGNKNLNIKVPAGHWYKETNYFVKPNRTNRPAELEGELAESFKNSKLWSGVWIQDDRSDSSWIFQDIDIFIENKKYSQVFCKGDDCRQKRDTEDDIWINEKQDKEQVQQMIQQISTSKGEWVDTEKFCRRSRSRNLPPDQLKDLELFCFSKQN